jgi:chitodextrinase
MSRKRQHKQKQLKAAPRGRRFVAAVCLALALLLSGGILAQRGLLLRKAATAGRPGSGVAPGSASAVAPSTGRQSGSITPQSASSPSKEYIYAGGKLIATEEPSVSPPPGPTGAPVNLTALISSSGSITLDWSYGGTGQIGFKVFRTDTPSGPIGTPGRTTYLDKINVNPGVTYTYYVTATNNNGDSPPSNSVAVTIPTAVPVAPGPLNAVVVSGPEVDLTWNDNSNNEDGFKVQRAPSGGASSTIAVLCANSTSYADKAVSSPAAYTYQITAFNAIGDSPAALGILVKIPAPAPVLSLGTITPSSIAISWTESAAVDSFNIYRNGGSTPIANVPSSQTTFTDPNLTPNTVYSYQVTAVSNIGVESATSNSVTATTQVGCLVTTFSGNGTYGTSTARARRRSGPIP